MAATALAADPIYLQVVGRANRKPSRAKLLWRLVDLSLLIFVVALMCYFAFQIIHK
jgi:hypothetical protein